MWEDIGNRTPSEIAEHGPVYRQWVRREWAAGRFLGFVVEDGTGSPAGSGVVWLAPAQPRPGRFWRLESPYIASMFTEPAFRRRGVASRIVREMIRWAKSRRYPRVTLHASIFGRPVYARLGFIDGNEMRLDLGKLPTPRVVRRRARS